MDWASLYQIASLIPEPIANVLLLLVVVGMARNEKKMTEISVKLAALQTMGESIINRRRSTDRPPADMQPAE